jgi:hypothetical protein
MTRILLVVLFFFNISLQAQNVVSGKVVDKTSQEPLIGCHIRLGSVGSYNMTVTDANGFFSLYSDLFGKDSLYVSYVGFETISTVVVDETRLLIELDPKSLNEVLIESTPIQKFNSLNSFEYRTEELKLIPSLAGELDVIKVLNVLPGVAQTFEGSSNLTVRGGSRDQNMILLDNAPVYNVNHLFGFLSVFNGDAVKNVTLMKGGISSRYGGRLSSIIDVKMKEGNKKEFHGKVNVGLIASGVFIETPLQKDRTSLMTAARFSTFDIYSTLNSAITSGEDPFSYSMTDLNVKVNHVLKNQGSLSLNFYNGNDNYEEVAKFGTVSDFQAIRWGNQTFSTRFFAPLRPSLSLESIAYLTKYEYQRSLSFSVLDSSSFSTASSNHAGIMDIGAKVYLRKTLKNSVLSAGIEGSSYTFIPLEYQSSITSGTDQFSVTNSSDIEPLQLLTAIFEYSFSKANKLNFDIGFRGYFSSYDLNVFKKLTPRVNFEYIQSDKLSFTASYGVFRQFLHLVTNNAIGFSNDIWIPSSDDFPSQVSQQLDLSMNYVRSKFSFQTQVFFKRQENLVTHFDGKRLFERLDDRITDVFTGGGSGTIYGFELGTNYKTKRQATTLNYTYSKSLREFPNINDGRAFPFQFDRPHVLSIMSIVKLNEKLSLSTAFNYMSGYRFTTPVNMFDIDYNLSGGFTSNRSKRILAYDERNNGKMPNYHRLDMSLIRTKISDKGKKRELVVGVYNIYGRRNPLYIETRESSSVSGLFSSVSYFQFIPSISYSFQI